MGSRRRGAKAAQQQSEGSGGLGCLVVLAAFAGLVMLVGRAPTPQVRTTPAAAVVSEEPAPPPPPPVETEAAREAAAWQLAESERDTCIKPKRALDCDHTEGYLEDYPEGPHAAEAKKRLAPVRGLLAVLRQNEPPAPPLPAGEVEEHSGGGYHHRGGGRRRHRRH